MHHLWDFVNSFRRQGSGPGPHIEECANEVCGGSSGVSGDRLDEDLVDVEDAGICIDCVESGFLWFFLFSCGIRVWSVTQDRNPKNLTVTFKRPEGDVWVVCMTSLGLLLLGVTMERLKLTKLAHQPVRTGVHGHANYLNDKMSQI